MIAGAVFDSPKTTEPRERTSAASWRLALGAAALSGVLLWLAAEPLAVGWLAWVAIVPAAGVALTVPGRAGRAAVPVAFAVYLELLVVPSLPFGLAEGQWGDPALPVLVGGSPVLVVALLAVPLVALALYGLGFGRAPGGPGGHGAGAGAPDSGRPPSGWRGASLAVAGPAASWTALDLIRAKLDPGGLWGELFLDVSGGPAGSIAAAAGPWALTFAVAAVNYGIALALVRRNPLPALIPIAASALVALLAAPVAGSPPGPAADESLTVAAIQPGYDTADEELAVLRFFRPGTYDLAAIDLIEDLTEPTLVAARRGAKLIVWPEAAIWVDPRRERVVGDALAGLANRAGATLVVPFFVYEASSGAAIAVAPSRDAGATFSVARPKHRPMWFLGEDAEPADPRPLTAARAEVGTMLGVDTQDPGVAASLADSGAGLLTSSTHDWRQLAPHHLAHARTAAVATGLPLVRADWRFGSAIFDASGDPVSEAGEGERRDVVVGTVDPAGSPTPYATLGDAVGWACVALGAAWLAAGATRRSRGRASA